ncbi:hypothetical protein SALBM311S_05666 [Streptomyces alboniger]
MASTTRPGGWRRSPSALEIPFIGHPSSFEHSFQPQLMRETGARHIVDSLHSIDEELLRTLDAEAAERSVWRD